MNYNFFVKSNVHFGCGAVSRIGEIVKGHGLKKVMLVYDSGVKAAGIADRVMRELSGAGVTVVIFDRVIPNPTNETVEEAAVLARAERVGGFVAVGGGSSMDTAKAINVLMTNPGTIEEYGGMDRVTEECLPLIAIPTTAGTSSEITNVSALIDTKKVIKYVIIDNHIVASDVIADPELTLTVPPAVTAATGMDAITHAVESYISNMATPLTEYNSLKALEILRANIERVVENGADLAAREQMMLGCIIAGFAFSNANLGLVHAIAHTLSAHFGLAHGVANAAVLPYVIEFNAASCPEKMIKLAETVGLHVTGDREKDIRLISGDLRGLVRRLGIKTLSEQGIRRSDFDRLCDDVLREPVLGFNPRQDVTKADVLAILEKAY